jgi:hypothetical protein
MFGIKVKSGEGNVVKSCIKRKIHAYIYNY